ncbi:MAG: lipoprotein insertase outer membrane protein LolB [Gammaproteobacteria bacterium]|nr:lipoprotein insertase outer membrane protein LolB [Gammaproteobacteria bacterium]
MLCRRIGPGLLAGILVLTGCATPPRVPPAELDRLWQQHRQTLQHKDDWALTARIAGSTEEDGWSGKLSWQQSGENYQIHFQAPFGQGAAQLLGGPERVEMRTSDEQVIIAEDAESLLYQQLGWRLPLKGLRYWVLGLPMPDTQSTDDEPLLVLDQAGHLSRLQQSHWQVKYEAYRRVGEVDLPQKIYLQNHALNLRLVIDHWRLNGQ